MAETIISPGVFTRENDISFIQPAPVTAGAAIIGPAVKGPVEIPTLVTSYGDYIRKFGTTFTSGSDSYEFLTSIAVKNYFQQGGNSVLVSRVVTGSFDAASSTTIANTTATVGLTFANGKVVIPAAAATGQEFQIVGGGETYNFTAIVGTLPDDIPSANQYYFTPGSTAENTVDNLGNKIDSISGFPVDWQDPGAATTTFILSGSASGTTYNGFVFSSGSAAGSDPAAGNGFTLAGGTDTTTATANSFVITTLGKGKIYNNAIDATTIQQNSDSSLVSGSSDNLRWEISNKNEDLGTFTLSIRQGDDSLKSKIVLETFNNVSLDPKSPNYIESVIGNQVKVLSTDGDGSKYIATQGEFVNKSNYVRVSSVPGKTLNYLANDGLSVNVGTDNISYSASLPIAQSGSFFGAVGDHFGSRRARYYHKIDVNDTQGLSAGCYPDIISVLENSDDYVFNIISAPGLAYNLTGHSTPIDSIISLAETRGDCIAVVDLVDYSVTGESTVTGKAATLNSSYAASYWPWLQTQSATGRNQWIPASAVIPGVYAFTDNSSAPWFAPAGLVRGGITGVIQAQKRLTRTQRDTLYSKKVNPIASFPGQGISVFGQKTLQTKASALDRVNVRRLLIELKKFIGDESRNLVFEQNTLTTRNRFLARVNPYLESVVQRQGLYAYRVVMDDTNNTADVVDRNQLIGQIFIQPAKTAEFVVLDFTIEPTGATFAG